MNLKATHNPSSWDGERGKLASYNSQISKLGVQVKDPASVTEEESHWRKQTQTCGLHVHAPIYIHTQTQVHTHVNIHHTHDKYLNDSFFLFPLPPPSQPSTHQPHSTSYSAQLLCGVLSIVPGGECTKVSKPDTHPCPHGIHHLAGEKDINQGSARTTARSRLR
jgi:hypothetical protein